MPRKSKPTGDDANKREPNSMPPWVESLTDLNTWVTILTLGVTFLSTARLIIETVQKSDVFHKTTTPDDSSK